MSVIDTVRETNGFKYKILPFKGHNSEEYCFTLETTFHIDRDTVSELESAIGISYMRTESRYSVYFEVGMLFDIEDVLENLLIGVSVYLTVTP